MTEPVRAARPDDGAVVQAVARESWHAAYDEVIGAETVDRTIDRWYALDSLADQITDAAGRDDATFLVFERVDSPDAAHADSARSGTDNDESAKTESEIVGFAHAGPHPDLAGTAKLSRIYARPDVWGEGVGSRLLERVERELGPHFETLWLEVLADNDVGVSFYEATGFARVGEQESVLGDGGVREYIYEKELS
ncbi:acetyltransferase [Halovivax ruber XH-70]|uniref:Acetyltransferase n=1 Tax=Halovivax ruber (strain DSM 18193 / JCM 13892 / XH-70) TaxID=797302 RepID=L0I6G1_HALRX|nr:GNAT family N-acetyltransferase [Halovivax ruber]AGB15135.1 acetyltransferase [Halovivax ruber XH-70]